MIDTRRLAGQFLATLVALAATTAARADSDGHYCIAKGYIAYELRYWSSPEKQHVLKVVRVGGAAGIAKPVTLVLPDFQLHGMKCAAHAILIESFEDAYRIDLPPAGAPSIASVDRLSGPPASTEGRETARGGYDPRVHDYGSFGYLQASRSVPIPADSDRRYALDLRYRARSHMTSGKGGVIYHDVTARVRETDERGRLVRERPLYKQTRLETID